MADVGLRREGLEVGRLAGEARDRGARAHHDRGQPGQRVRHRVREREREEVDLRVGPQQPERQHREPRQRPGERAPGRAVGERDRVELGDELGRRRGPLGGTLGERPADEPVERDHGGVAGERGRLFVQRRRQHLDDARAEEGGAPRDRLVQDRPGGEQVGARVGVVAEHLLGRHVARRAHEQAGPGELGAGLERLRELARERARETEVEQLHPVGGQERVRGLEVAVERPARVERRERREHLARERHRLGDGQRPALEAIGERLALEQLHGDEQLPAVLADLVDLAHVRVVDARRGARLAPEALAGRLVGLGDRLDRDLAPEALVLGGEDDAHAALPEPVEDAVAAEPVRIARGGRRGRPAQPVHQPSQQPLAGRALGKVRRGIRRLVLGHRGCGCREYTRPP